jgi:hypothetical protein
MNTVLSLMQQVPNSAIGACAAVISAALPSGLKEMALGKYCIKWPNLSSYESMKLVYGKREYNLLCSNPKLTWAEGHFLDLSHKVLAAIFIYSTLSLPKSFLPPAAHRLASRALPFVALSPIIFKIIHIFFDYLSMHGRGWSTCRRGAFKVAKTLETLFFSPFVFLPFKAAMPAFVGYHVLHYAWTRTPRYYLDVLSSFLYLLAGRKSQEALHLPNSNNIFTDFDEFRHWRQQIKIDGLKFRVEELSQACEELKKVQLISGNQARSLIHPKLTQLLQDKVYTPLTKKQFDVLEKYETLLRQVFSPNGPSMAFLSLEDCFLFANMLLCANLYRLSLRTDLTPAQSDMVQLILCCQAVRALGWDSPRKELAEGDFCKDLRTLFATELCTNISNTTLIVYLNRVAEKIGAKKISYPTAPGEDVVKQITSYFSLSKFTALTSTIQPENLQNLVETKASFLEICTAVKDAVSE